MNADLGYFEPGQFVPVYAPDGEVVVSVGPGRGLVRDGDDDRVEAVVTVWLRVRG